LEKEIFNEFEDIVGAGNIDDGEVIAQCYAYNWCMEVFNYIDDDSPNQFGKAPKAVLLPSTTEEVQSIVKLCSKHGIKVKCHSTGLGAWSNVSTDNAILLDLRRMNKIIKIDVKNLYAVVESYVTGAQLQTEVMKYGLNCHISGAGSQVSPLASHTSMGGPGFTSPQTGHSARNVLGVEWVLPTGEIIKLGTFGLKNHPDWFNGDGPGPSLRGVMRGWLGALSGLGIFTKVAIKLFPYPCSTKFKLSGQSPNYDFEIPDYIRVYVLDCSSFKQLEKSLLRIEEEEITFVCSYMSGLALTAIFSNSIESLMGNVALGSLRFPILIIIAGRTKREFTYKQNVMQFLMEELELVDIIGTKYIPEPIFYAEALRANLGLHGFVGALSFQSAGGSADTIALCLNALTSNIMLKKKYIEKGAIANDLGEGSWGTTYEHGHFSHCEFPTMFDQTNKYSIEGMADYLENNQKLQLTNSLGVPFYVVGTPMHELFGPYMMDYHKWLRKIKETFDPNDISDSGFYISPKRKNVKDFKLELNKKLRRWQYESERSEIGREFEPLKISYGRYVKSIGRSIQYLISIFRPRKKSSKVLILPEKKRKK
jgi:hypothetical protein